MAQLSAGALRFTFLVRRLLFRELKGVKEMRATSVHFPVRGTAFS